MGYNSYMMAKGSNKCPRCGYEYESWVEVCPDCNVPVRLVMNEAEVEHDNPALGEGDNPQWAIAANVPNAIIGSLIKSQLEDAGIPVIMMRSRSADIAEFSHNDYVAQDIRVPGHLREQARQLIYAAPDNLHLLDIPQADEEDTDSGSNPYKSNLPEGWTLLPDEGDMRERREMVAGRGETPSEWYWSDERRQDSLAAADMPADMPQENTPVIDWRSQQGHMARENPFENEMFKDEEWPKPQKWIKVLYGVMLLAITLPFILQLFEGLARFFK